MRHKSMNKKKIWEWRCRWHKAEEEEDEEEE